MKQLKKYLIFVTCYDVVLVWIQVNLIRSLEIILTIPVYQDADFKSFFLSIQTYCYISSGKPTIIITIDVIIYIKQYILKSILWDYNKENRNMMTWQNIKKQIEVSKVLK